MSAVKEKAERNGATGVEVEVAPGTFLTVSQIMDAPADCREEILEVPEWGGRLKLRSPTALAAAAIKSSMITMDAEGQTVSMDIAAAERTQFRMGVVEPVFTEAQVEALQAKVGPSWQRVIAALDGISGPLGKPTPGGGEAAFPGGG